MTKAEYLQSLYKALNNLTKEEREQTLSYYGEIIDDRIESGMSEQEAVGSMEDISAIAGKLAAEADAREDIKPKRSRMNTALLIIGSPLWITLLLTACAVLLAVYAAAWAVLISFIAAEIAIAFSGLAGIAGLIIYLGKNTALAFALLGCGLICISLALFIYYPLVKLIKWTARGTLNIWKRFFGFIKDKAGVKK